MLTGVFQKVQERLSHPFSVAARHRLPCDAQLSAGKGRGQQLPLPLHQSIHILLLKGKAVSVGTEPFQAEKSLN